MREGTTQQFIKKYGHEPSHMICSPGRVNLIGEHTDYNDGFVMPMCLENATYMAVKFRHDAKIHIHSQQFDQSLEIDIHNLGCKNPDSWQCYIEGVIWSLLQFHPNIELGFDAVINSNIPIGAGLSSSASFELAIAKALCTFNPIEWNPTKMAIYCQKAENEWVGVNCGIMDQLICAIGKKDHAAVIDCRTLEADHVPLPENTVIVIMDTGTRRGLVDSAYNERRMQCESAAEIIGVKALRDVSIAKLDTFQARMDPITYKRAHHVVSENERVLDAAQKMKLGNAVDLGMLMCQSHESLDQDFEVTSDALNAIVEIGTATEGCYGARMTGAGFGGCAVALVDEAHADKFIEIVTNRYKAKTGNDGKLYASRAEDGCNLK